MVSLTFLSILIILIPGFCFETKNFARYNIPNACCHSYTRRQIPYSRVVDFYETSSFCLKSSIIFITNQGRQVCANPRNEWVQVYIFRLKQKEKTKEYPSYINHFYKNVELSPPEEYDF
ncbi:C-C motif chemokine 4 homolog [Petaurus breviceps papuanus]|uniref:C-C motif chemokine 4 homolog n=1 Tax=Petaurus breviceps papuanus TaxID=3040969 RepID=UPI0036DAF628